MLTTNVKTDVIDADALSLRRYVKGLPGLLFDPGAAVASLSLATEPAGPADPRTCRSLGDVPRTFAAGA